MNQNKCNKNSADQMETQNKINLDYDWNTEYGDGDIPDIDKNCSHQSSEKNCGHNKQQ